MPLRRRRGAGLSRVARAVRFRFLSDYGRLRLRQQRDGLRRYLPHRALSPRSLPDPRGPRRVKAAPETAAGRGCYWLVRSPLARPGGRSSPCTRNQVFSAMLVAWSPMRSMFLAMNSRWVQPVMLRASSIM